MKKVFKFFVALASLAAVAGGAYLVYKNFFAKDDSDFDFDDSFGDEEVSDASREYVSINITTDETEEEDEETAENESSQDSAGEEADD